MDVGALTSGLLIGLREGVEASLIVAIIAGFRWLRSQIRDEFENLTKSQGFRALVTEIITEASAGWNDLNNRQHEEHRAAIKHLAKRDEERAGAIKIGRAHV